MLILKIIYGMAQQLGLVQHHSDCRQAAGSREKKDIVDTSTHPFCTNRHVGTKRLGFISFLCCHVAK